MNAIGSMFRTGARAPAGRIARIGLLLLALAQLAGCQRPESATQRAQAFWDALADGRRDDAAALLVPGDRARQLAALDGLQIDSATVEALEVPDAAEVAILPTTVVLKDDRDWQTQTSTVLRRSGDTWLVDLEETRHSLRTASVDALGNRIAAAARRLRDALGRNGPELGRALERFGDDLAGLVNEDAQHRSEEMAEALTQKLRAAGDKFADGLDALAGALSEAAGPPSGRDGSADEPAAPADPAEPDHGTQEHPSP